MSGVAVCGRRGEWGVRWVVPHQRAGGCGVWGDGGGCVPKDAEHCGIAMGVPRHRAARRRCLRARQHRRHCGVLLGAAALPLPDVTAGGNSRGHRQPRADHVGRGMGRGR